LKSCNVMAGSRNSGVALYNARAASVNLSAHICLRSASDQFPIAAELSIISKNSPIGGAVSPPLHRGTSDTSDRSFVAARLRVASTGSSFGIVVCGNSPLST